MFVSVHGGEVVEVGSTLSVKEGRPSNVVEEWTGAGGKDRGSRTKGILWVSLKISFSRSLTG